MQVRGYVIYLFYILVKDMNNVLFFVDQAKFHTSYRLREYYKNNKLKVIENAVANPEFAPIELCFNKWKNAIRT